MALDALRGYLAMATGVTEVTRQKAVATAKAILNDETLAPLAAAGAVAHNQVHGLADDILATGRANRDLLLGLIRSEVERAISSAGVATGDEVAALRAQVDRLVQRVATLEAQASAAAVEARAASTAKRAPAKRAATKKTESTGTASAAAASGTPA